MKKTVLSLLLVMLLSLGLTACGGGDSSQTSDTAESNAAEATPAVSGDAANIVTDELGREVTIPENPQKILALTSAAMQALYNIGIEPVGKVEEYKVTEEGVALPSVGKSQEINIESVYALKPELIIASSRFHAALEEELEQSGAVVYYFDPDKAGDIPLVEVTTLIGKLLGKEDVADTYVQSIYAMADELKQKLASESEIKTGIVIQDGDTITAAQSASSYGSMLSLLGIENIVPDDLPNAKKASFVSFDVETIIASNPDVIFIMTASKDAENNKAILEKYKNDPQWSSLDAVKNNKLLILPFSVNPNRSTPEDMVKATADAILKSNK